MADLEPAPLTGRTADIGADTKEAALIIPLNVILPAGLDLVVIDGSFLDSDYAYLVPAIASFREVPDRVWGAEDLTRIVRDLCARTQDRVMRLRVVAMGNLEGFWLGKDWVSPATLPRLAPALAGLKGCFGSPRSPAQILCHESGLNGALRRELAAIWGLERVDEALSVPVPLDNAGPRGLAANAYKVKTRSVRYENDEGMSNSIFYW